jgi:GTP-binding protein
MNSKYQNQKSYLSMKMGKKHEPMEKVTIDVSNEFSGSVIEKLGQRKGELVMMSETSGGYSRLEFSIPARGLIGYRQEFMTDTKGNGIMNSIFDGYAKYKGDIPKRQDGSIIAFETGEATAYGLFAAQARGILFIGPGVNVYEGMVVGSNPKGMDIEVNITKKKQQSNVRASGSDDSLRLSTPKTMSLEEILEFIEDDELIEVTPISLRIRKRTLNKNMRYKSKKK